VALLVGLVAVEDLRAEAVETAIGDPRPLKEALLNRAPTRCARH